MSPEKLSEIVAAFVSGFPAFGQFVFYSVLALIAAALGKIGLAKGKATENAPKPTDAVLLGASITDLKPLRDLSAGIEHLTSETAKMAIAAEIMAEVMQEWAEEIKRERINEDLIRRMRANKTDEEEARRRPTTPRR